MRAPMPQHYVSQGQHVIERVPRPPHLSPHCESIPGLVFCVNGHPGVLVKHVLEDSVIIDGANDTVLEAHRFRTIVISLEVWTVASPLCPLF